MTPGHMADIHQEQPSIKNMQVTFLKSCLLYSFVWGLEMSDFQTVFFVCSIKGFSVLISNKIVMLTIFRGQILQCKIVNFWVFMKNLKMGNFVLQISPWKKWLRKKQNTPWRRQRKMQQNCHFRFLIFKILSQRFFHSKFGKFHFFAKKKKKLEF